MSKHDALLAWRHETTGHGTADALAGSLTVEGLRYEDIPADLWPSVRAWRQLLTTTRLRHARAFLAKRGAK